MNSLIVFSAVTILYALLLVVVILFLLSLISDLISMVFGAPYIPVPKKYIKKILSIGALGNKDILYDLGCGDGRVLMSALFDFRISKAVGYEIAMWPYLKFLFLSNCKRLSNIKIIRQNCLKADVGQATCIYLYLLPNLVDKIAYKIAREVKPKTKILCVGFPIDTNKHTDFQLLRTENIGEFKIYLYELKKFP